MLSAPSSLVWIAGVCLAGATFGCFHLTWACFLVLRFARGREANLAAAPGVTILKPLHGPEPHLYERFASFCNQDYPGPIQLVFGTQDQDDPAIEMVERLKTAFPEREITLAIDPREHGSNRKVSNLINMTSSIRHDVVLVSDSDIQVAPKYLRLVVAELQQPGVGAVTCLYHGLGGAGLWSRISALAINTHFIPEVITGLSLGLTQPCFGATIALSRQMLRRIGGFAALSECMADDYMIGQAVRSAGSDVIIPNFTVGHVCFENNLAALIGRQIRFARTIKGIDPIGYVGSILTHPLPLALLAALLGAQGALLVAGLALGCRAALCYCVERAYGLERQPYWLIPLQDLMLFTVYTASFFGATVSWRGHRYRLASDGSLAQIEK